MKEFLQTDRVTYNLMSFTAFKSLLLFSYLLEAPRSYPEIREYFGNQKYLNETISIDTLRVYINSLERMGCVIKRGKKADGSKYHLLQHPFELQMSEDYVKSIIKVYKSISKSIEVEELLYLAKFFKKIAKNIKNQNLKEKLEGLSPLSKIDSEIFLALLKSCRKQEEITFMYQSPNSGIKSIDLLAQKLSVNNNKVYVHGVSPNYEGTATFLVSRIRSLPVVKLEQNINTEIQSFIVGCEIYDKLYHPKDNEKIVSSDEQKFVIEIDCTSKFYTMQRVLSFGKDCKVLYPEDFKCDLISVLKKMKDEYVR